ncbi:MAG: hypothetical protein ACOZBH_02965 [Patescibacteria group bacterium]
MTEMSVKFYCFLVLLLGIFSATAAQASPPAECGQGFRRVETSDNGVKLVRCEPKPAYTCMLVEFAGHSEQRCYRVIGKAPVRVKEPPAPAPRQAKAASVEELLEQLSPKAGTDPDTDRAIELLNLYQEGQKRSEAAPRVSRR